jgi:hypothetical protein
VSSLWDDVLADVLPVGLDLSQTLKKYRLLPSRVGGAAQSLDRPLEGPCFRRGINNAGVDPR